MHNGIVYIYIWYIEEGWNVYMCTQQYNKLK